MSQATLEAPPFRTVDILRHKRDGRENSPAEIQHLVDAYTSGEIPDYQVAAWLMAVIFRGMNHAERQLRQHAGRGDAAVGQHTRSV